MVLEASTGTTGLPRTTAARNDDPSPETTPEEAGNCVSFSGGIVKQIVLEL
jgi:hypothetical protein